jgi:hypothetical protein
MSLTTWDQTGAFQAFNVGDVIYAGRQMLWNPAGDATTPGFQVCARNPLPLSGSEDIYFEMSVIGSAGGNIGLGIVDTSGTMPTGGILGGFWAQNAAVAFVGANCLIADGVASGVGAIAGAVGSNEIFGFYVKRSTGQIGVNCNGGAFTYYSLSYMTGPIAIVANAYNGLEAISGIQLITGPTFNFTPPEGTFCWPLTGSTPSVPAALAPSAILSGGGISDDFNYGLGSLLQETWATASGYAFFPEQPGPSAVLGTTSDGAGAIWTTLSEAMQGCTGTFEADYLPISGAFNPGFVIEFRNGATVVGVINLDTAGTLAITGNSVVSGVSSHTVSAALSGIPSTGTALAPATLGINFECSFDYGAAGYIKVMQGETVVLELSGYNFGSPIDAVTLGLVSGYDYGNCFMLPQQFSMAPLTPGEIGASSVQVIFFM